MARRHAKTFFLFVVDRDRQMFNVLGPMTDDSAWTDYVCALQGQGRSVNCFTTASGTREAIEAYERQQRLTYTAEPLFPGPTPESTAPTGRIPGYAARADQSRLVNILCKKDCGKAVWAEMEQPFPGLDVLGAAQAGDYTARCLRCGGIARDPYNWTR